MSDAIGYALLFLLIVFIFFPEELGRSYKTVVSYSVEDCK